MLGGDVGVRAAAHDQADGDHHDPAPQQERQRRRLGLLGEAGRPEGSHAEGDDEDDAEDEHGYREDTTLLNAKPTLTRASPTMRPAATGTPSLSAHLAPLRRVSHSDSRPPMPNTAMYSKGR